MIGIAYAHTLAMYVLAWTRTHRNARLIERTRREMRARNERG